jgi:hypothetical protein
MFKNAIALYEPINTYKPMADGIGVVDGPLVYMSYPGLSFFSIPFPTRMTVVRLSNGTLWLHSPTAYDEQLAVKLKEMGDIAHLVSPNAIHYAHMQAWKDRFPNAVSWASPGVRRRAQKMGIATHFDKDLEQEAPTEWGTDFKQAIIPGGVIKEVVFFHIASKTLILADTIQNFELEKIKQPYKFLVWAARAYAPRGQMPIDLRSTFFLRKKEIREVLREILSWEPERIVLSHGACITENAKEALEWAFRFALK